MPLLSNKKDVSTRDISRREEEERQCKPVDKDEEKHAREKM